MILLAAIFFAGCLASSLVLAELALVAKHLDLCHISITAHSDCIKATGMGCAFRGVNDLVPTLEVCWKVYCHGQHSTILSSSEDQFISFLL